MSYRAGWQALVDAEDISAAFCTFFQFLVETPEGEPLLQAIATKATSATIQSDGDNERLEIEIASPDGEDMWQLNVLPPFTGDAPEGVPESLMKVARRMNGLWIEGGDVPFSFDGIDEDGICTASFEYGALREGDNAELLAALQAEAERRDEDFSLREMIKVPITNRQDWVVYNPLVRTSLGEPALCHVSHGDCKVQAPISVDLGFGGVLLRLLAKDLTDAEPPTT
jgi:hypothetical protein